MRLLRLKSCLLLAVGVAAALRADTPAADSPRVMVPPMKTSIYVGSVTLTTTDFVQQNDSFTAGYEARVRPWFFWGESGRITIKLAMADLTRLALGQTIEFTGDAINQRNKPRPVTGRAQPATATGGKIKVRVLADGIELIFNGAYQLSAGQPTAETPAVK